MITIKNHFLLSTYHIRKFSIHFSSELQMRPVYPVEVFMRYRSESNAFWKFKYIIYIYTIHHPYSALLAIQLEKKKLIPPAYNKCTFHFLCHQSRPHVTNFKHLYLINHATLYNIDNFVFTVGIGCWCKLPTDPSLVFLFTIKH